jgi:prepilin-type N-terminal cleavage/methylation domain-containing protein
VDSRRGFTLFELLVILLIMGILISIAISSFYKTVNKTAESAAKSDLRNAMTTQEAYMAEFNTYANLANLPITMSKGVEMGGGGTAGGYRLTARHQRSPATFSVAVGDGSSTDGKIVQQ